LAALAACWVPIAAVVGKTWDLHIEKVLRVDREENLRMISESVAFLRHRDKRVFYDAEHFFDAYAAHPEYAVACLRAAAEAGAETVCLCDTNGAALPTQVGQVIEGVLAGLGGICSVGIHTHNDAGCAVANALIAVEHGADWVQGTVNGYGERCGNADLCAIIPALKLKMGFDCISGDNLAKLTDTAHFVAELCNVAPDPHQPYVGHNAFAHKGGMHVSAVQKHPDTYEHVDPEAVGNHRRVLVSELAGKSNILWKAREYGIDLDRDTPDSRRILDRLKALEDEGFQFEGAEASFELLMERALDRHRPYFELDAYRVIVEEQSAGGEPVAEATVRVRVKGILEHTAAAGNGPVNALDHALRKALEEFYPNLKALRLLDYKVRILDESKGTAAKTRVLITSGDGVDTWGTVGVADNIIEASWQALVDSVEYKLRADERRSRA
jgi:2-isopropylmalate synthase